MDAQQKALAQIQQWNSGQAVGGSVWGSVSPKQRKAPPKGRSGLAKWAPAIGGAAAGIAAAPFTGGLSLAATLAAVGGATAAGSAIGEFGAQRASDERTNFGKIGKEAAIGGALGAIPIGGVGRAAKAAKSAGAATATTTGRGVTGKLAEVGRRLETRAGGYGIGEKFTGRAPITHKSQAGIQATLKAEKIPKGHPETQAKAIEAKLDGYHAQLEAALKSTNKKLYIKERRKIANDYLKKIDASPTVDDAVRRAAQQYANNFVKQTKDLTGVNAFRRGVDKKGINYIANPDSATAAKQEAAQVMRTHLSDTISKLAPSVKSVNTKYSKLTNANGYVIQQAGRLTRQSENAGAGITGRLIAGDNAQAIKSNVGDFMQRIPGATPPASTGGRNFVGRGSGATTEVLKQGLGRQVLNPQVDPVEADPYGPETYGEQDYTGMADGQFPQETPQAATLEDALYQAQSVLGPNQTPATYLSYAKAFQATNKADNPSAAEKKSSQGVATATQIANNIERQLSQIPTSGRIGGAFGTLAGALEQSPKLRAYQTSRQGTALLLVKALQGSAGQISDQDRKAIAGYIPSVFDTKEEQASKLQLLRQLIDSYSAKGELSWAQ